MGILSRNDRFILVLMSSLLLFLLINFDRTLGLVFGTMLGFTMFFLITDDNITYRIDRGANLQKSILVAVIGYFAFIYVASLYFSSSVQSILTTLSSTTPILQGSKLFTVIGWGIVIPFVETVFFFGPFMEAFADKYGVSLNFNLTNIRTWVLFIFVSLVFMFFHLTAKGVHDTAALTLTTIFAIVSLWMAAYFRELKAPIAFHSIMNTISVAISLGLIAMS